MVRFRILSLVVLMLFLSVEFSGCVFFYEPQDKASNVSVEDEENLKRGELKATYIVKEVVDGDTLVLSNNERVRLLGINAPEYGSYFYNEAKQILEILVLGEKIRLEKDLTDRDKYGRLLRYVYRDSLFVNLEMIKRGFASIYTCPPDVKYAEEFLEAERFARVNKLGLWKESSVSCILVELNYDAEGDDRKNLNGEYAIIENIGNSDINIKGWTVKDSSTNIYKFGNFILKSGSRIYLFSGSGKDGGGDFYWGSQTPIWNNDHDTLYLRDKEGLLIEIYNY